MGRETLSTSPGSGVVSVLAGGPNCASGGVPGHIGTCVWPGDGCQPGFWANRLLAANTTQKAKIKGFITSPQRQDTTQSGADGTTKQPVTPSLNLPSSRHQQHPPGEAAATPTDLDYWIKRSSASVLKIVDECLIVINQKANPRQSPTYNKYFIGLNDGARSRNFVHFKPKKQFLHVLAEIEDKQRWITRFEEQAVSATAKDGGRFLKVTIKPTEWEKHSNLLAELLLGAVDEYQR